MARRGALRADQPDPSPVNPERSLTVTQRQPQASCRPWADRPFQLYRDDGGGVPLCCTVTAHAIELLGLTGRDAPALDPAALDGLCTDVHLVGWLLALEARAGDAVLEVLGPGRAAIVPGACDPAALELAHGLRPATSLSGSAGAVWLTGTGRAVRRRATGRGRHPAGGRRSDRPTRRSSLIGGVERRAEPPPVLEAYDHQAERLVAFG